jgi:O-antigen/teichoic acid export membrane protein
MLVAAPLLLRALGAQQYGAWMLVNAIAATASGLGGGFGDGATKYVSMYQGCGDRDGALRSMMAVLVVNCGFGLLAGAIVAASAPWLIGHVFTVPASLQHAGIVALRISAALLFIRFAETVFTSTIRGCEQYRPTVVISVVARTLTTLAALLLALIGYGLIAILWATLFTATISCTAQMLIVHKLFCGEGRWRLASIGSAVREVFSFGAFTWLKSTLGVLISHGDRLLVAWQPGTAPLAFYSLCNQLTQPIHALTASAFNFVFPSFSAKSAAGHWPETRRNYRIAAVLAALLISATSATLIVGARPILRLWLGASVASQYHDLLITMVIGNGLLALSVVPHYAALAFGRARSLVLVNLAAGILSLGCGYLLIHRFGVIGAGFGKIIAGLVFLSVFRIVRSALRETEGTLPVYTIDSSVIAGMDIAQ